MIRTALLLALAAQPDDAALKSRQAKELMAAGRYAEAAPIYAELVKTFPNDPRLLLNLGLAQQMAGQCGAAVRQFEAAAKLRPDLYPAWVSLGGCYLDLGTPAKAIAPLEKAAALAPREPMPHQMLGDALFTLGRFDAAARRLRQFAELEPRNPAAWYGLGKAYEALARQAFQRLDKAGQGSAWWLARVAETKLSEKQYAAAFTLYREALAKSPKLRDAHAGLAEVYRSTGHADWAAAAQAAARKLPPPDCAAARQECAFAAGRMLAAAQGPPGVETYYWQSRAYSALAAQSFARLEQLPPSLELHRFRAQVASARREYLEAATELREALKLAPGHPQLQLELAAALHSARDHAGALQILQGLPASPEVAFMTGDTLLEVGQIDKAIPLLESAVRAQPGDLPSRASLGMAYARSGRLDRALEHLKAAQPIDTDGRVHFQLARAYQAAGQAELAKEAMRKYQELQKPAAAAEISPP